MVGYLLFSFDWRGIFAMSEIDYSSIGAEIGKLVKDKNAAYGDSFHHSAFILKVLFPNRLRPEQYPDLLAIVRVLDKLFRIATDKDAFGENPWRDIAGYAMLMCALERRHGDSGKGGGNADI